MIVIRPQKDLYAKLEGKIAPDVEAMMREFFVWRNPLDFEDYYQLYAKGYMYVGIMHNVADYLRQSGYKVEVDMDILSPKDFEAEFTRPYRPLQKALADAAIEHRYGLLAAPPGAGKCLGKGTPILMYNGEVKLVEDIVVGDLIMGPDSLPRRVKSLARGREEMFRIVDTRGETFDCNKSHILSLYVSSSKARKNFTKYKNKTHINVSIDEYCKFKAHFKEKLKLYKPEKVIFPEQTKPKFDSYCIGLWLGDGLAREATITTMDKEVLEAWTVFGATLGLKVTKHKNSNSGKASNYQLVSATKMPYSNILRQYIRATFPVGQKHIPDDYKLGDEQTRLEILAGIIDSDGSLSGVCSYDVVSKYLKLAEDIAFVARSLGFGVFLRQAYKKCCNTGVIGLYYRVAITGDVNKIPVRIKRKFAAQRQQIKNPLVRGFTVTSLGEGDYYGFTLDGPDGLFVLGNFTVTHNTDLLTKVIAILGKKAVVLTQAEEPFEGAYETIRDYSTCKVGRVGGGYNEPSDVTVCMIQTWNRRLTADEVDPALVQVLRDAKVWITDEAHNCLTNSYFNMYEYAENVEYFLGTTATPFTSNDRETLLYARIGPILAEIKYGEAIDNNILVPFTCYIEDAEEQKFVKDKTKLAPYAKKRLWQKVKKEYIINNVKRNKQYVDFAKESNSLGLSCAIIVSQVNHGKNMKKLYPNAVEVYGPTPKKQRKEIWEKLKRKEIKCVITTLMDEATDIPSLDCVALAAGGKSKVKLIQRLRNLRTFAGETVDGWTEKERGYVFITRDNADYVKSHSDKNIGYLRELKREHHLNEIIKF